MSFTPSPSLTELCNQDLYRRARMLIPGGTQLLSKRPELFAPGKWPPYYKNAKGCTVTDLDGRTFVDFSTNGIGSCLLGFADPDVNAAVIDRIHKGSMSSLNTPDEVALAIRMLEIHPWGERARFARGGGEAMSVAVRIARASTGRDIIAFCGYHGWCDWYLSANLPQNGTGKGDALNGHLLSGLEPKGIPSQLAGTAIPFSYNNLGELRSIVGHHGKRLAAVVMEPTRAVDPDAGFLQGVRDLCDEAGACLIFDEVTSGFRLHFGGIHLALGVTPDIAVFAKALGNGHPIAAIIGRARWMDAAADTFISSTYWTESVGYAAAIATLEKMQRIGLPAHLQKIGNQMRQGLAEIAEATGVPLKVSGYPAQTYLSFRHPKETALLTLYTLRMLDHGYLSGGAFYPTYAHTPQHVEAFLKAAHLVFSDLHEAISSDSVERAIGGDIKHSGFQRLN